MTVATRRPGGAARAGKRYATITEALVDASAGEIVDVGPGRYTTDTGERFPLVVNAGVTVRAAASLATPRVVIDGGGSVAVQLAADSMLERVTVTGGAAGDVMVPATCVISDGGDHITVLDCHVESAALTGGAGHRVIGNVIAGGAVSLIATSGCEVRANYQHGFLQGVGIMVAGGAGHVVSENECCNDLCAISIEGAPAARVEHNRVETCWWGIRLLDAPGTVVASNRALRAMTAVRVEGAAATGNVIDRQLAEHCDVGVVLERGATETRITDSWLHACRVGLVAREAGSVEVVNTAISEPREHAVVADRDLGLDMANNQFDGDVWIIS